MAWSVGADAPVDERAGAKRGAVGGGFRTWVL
jgi:hypothetical protein